LYLRDKKKIFINNKMKKTFLTLPLSIYNLIKLTPMRGSDVPPTPAPRRLRPFRDCP